MRKDICTSEVATYSMRLHSTISQKAVIFMKHSYFEQQCKEIMMGCGVRRVKSSASVTIPTTPLLVTDYCYGVVSYKTSM
jgi:hypothetical protein